MSTTAATHRRARTNAHPQPPSGPDALAVLLAVRKRLAAVSRGERPATRPTATEDAIMRWLQYELGADAEMHRTPEYAELYEALTKRRKILDAIQEPEQILGDEAGRYPMDTSEVGQLLVRCGFEMDSAGQRIRRLADAALVRTLGSTGRRLFFGRDVARIAYMLMTDMSDGSARSLVRHARGEFSEVERPLAATYADPSAFVLQRKRAAG